MKEHESNSNFDTMAEIDNYQDSSSQSSDDIKSSNEKKVIVKMRRVVEIPKLVMRLKIPCLCQFVQEIFLVWTYEAFPHLGKYAKKFLNSPLPILCLLRLHTARNDNIIKGDPFKYKGINLFIFI
ncbi:hypothetical protein H5410_006224 [Solanum commersonii]|uniref:Uncharacterized protein n=1 Tax=Solanum commersonii TaxID=4109 RepID=A0A9J6A8L0_SOLCO|nr:hypothetical protein H5410_006224 [Solanum commersonii]